MQTVSQFRALFPFCSQHRPADWFFFELPRNLKTKIQHENVLCLLFSDFLCFFFFLFFCKRFFKTFLCFSSNRPTENQEMNLMLNGKKEKERKREREKRAWPLINVHWKRSVCNHYPVSSLVPQHAVSFIGLRFWGFCDIWNWIIIKASHCSVSAEASDWLWTLFPRYDERFFLPR